MRLYRFIAVAASLILPFFSVAAHADDFTYIVSNHFADFQVDGTITTDINGGIVSFGNIVDFNLTLTSAGQMAYLNYAAASNSGIVGDAFTATADGLFFDYSVAGAAVYLQDLATGTYLCFQDSGCDTVTSDPHESVSLNGAASLTQSQAGKVQIASAFSSVAVTPEPSSLLLLATGAVAAFTAGRRRLLL